MSLQFNAFNPNKISTELKSVEQHPILKTKVKKSTSTSLAVVNQIPKTQLTQNK